ncbi:MarR family winged helix-turn-helix transcriptional regulator [Chloroflexota bacterium]
MSVHYESIWEIPHDAMVDSITEDLDYDLWLLLRRTTIVLLRIRERELRQHGISSAQRGLLSIAEELGIKATTAEIARRVLRQPHSVSSLLTRMEARGLVKRVKDLDKANLIRIELTDKGRQILRQSNQRETIHRVASVLSKKERKTLMSYLKRMRDEAAKVPRQW